jgi:D-sedoheptulose 7-phosphate isomerase
MIEPALTADTYLARLQTELARIDVQKMECWADLIYRAWRDDRSVFIFGNGGSGATASHMSEDLGCLASTCTPATRRLKVMSLTDNVGWILAVANDSAFDQIFVQQLMNFARADDLVIAISGSGNSPNVLNAVDWANRNGLNTFGLTGYDGGSLKRIQRDGLHVDLDDMGMVESIHLSLFHWVLESLYSRIVAADNGDANSHTIPTRHSGAPSNGTPQQTFG